MGVRHSTEIPKFGVSGVKNTAETNKDFGMSCYIQVKYSVFFHWQFSCNHVKIVLTNSFKIPQKLFFHKFNSIYTYLITLVKVLSISVEDSFCIRVVRGICGKSFFQSHNLKSFCKFYFASNNSKLILKLPQIKEDLLRFFIRDIFVENLFVKMLTSCTISFGNR